MLAQSRTQKSEITLPIAKSPNFPEPYLMTSKPTQSHLWPKTESSHDEAFALSSINMMEHSGIWDV